MRQSPGSSCFARSHRNRGPSLHQRYPASSLLHPHPPSAAADSTPHEVVVDQRPVDHHHGLPLLHDRSVPMRAATTTPVDAAPASHARFGAAAGLPRCYGGSASTSDLSRPAQCSLTLRPAWPAGLLRGLFKKCFSPFVTSWTAPCASGRSESWPGRTGLGRSLAFTDGSTVPLQGTHNNWVENQIRPIALGRSNWLFAGSLRAGQRAAAIMSLVHSARINGHDPYAYLRDVLERLPTQPASRVGELLPHRWQAP